MKCWADWRAYPDERHVGQEIHEREAPTEPLLYSHDGRPLAEAKRTVGFTMKAKERRKR